MKLPRPRWSLRWIVLRFGSVTGPAPDRFWMISRARAFGRPPLPEEMATMATDVRRWFDLPNLLNNYKRRMPLILVNGLAEQSESWFANRTQLTRHFDVKVPETLV